MDNSVVDNFFTKRQIREYENIIKQIDEFYSIYRANGGSTFAIDAKINICLKDGIDGFKYYLHDYLNSDFVSEKLKRLIDRTQAIADLNNSNNIVVKYVDALSKTFDDIDTNATIINRFTQLQNKYNTNPEEFDSFKKALLFNIGLKIIPEFDEVFKSISKELSFRIRNNENPILAIANILEEKKINLDYNKLFDYFSVSKIREELKNELPDALAANSFISISRKLKRIVSLEMKNGKDKEEILNQILPEAYGLVKAVIEYVQKKTSYDVQLMGAIAMNSGNIVEMYTGEGKTLTAIFPAYLNALFDKEVDIFTPNDYLAIRDASTNKRVFELLDMTVGYIKEGQTIEEKQNAYKCNIVYGSSSEFAFDFLKDTTSKKEEELVQRVEKPGFVIVDEADQILIDDAETPYILNDSQKTLSMSEQKENDIVIGYMKYALEIEKMLSQKVKRVQNIYQFQALTEENADNQQEKYLKEENLLVFDSDDSSTTKVELTKKGEYRLFSYVLNKQIEELEIKNRDYFINSELFTEGIDYEIKNERLRLSTLGVEKAINNTKEFFDLYLKWLSEPEYQKLRKYVNNAIKARYVMKKGKDYQVIVNEETKKEEIKILKVGRIAKDSKYRDGLHQAIELKEGLEINIGENEKLLNDDSSTISNRALLSRYEKISGMTGTADKTMFSDVYGLETFSVPRNKEYEYNKNPIINNKPIDRIDNPTVLCKDYDEKIKLIINDVLSSYNNKQPVLIVTNNDEEAIYISEKINSIIDNGKAKLLTSKNTLEEEAAIISEAGMLGSITIATERAGRGTDIKLGGENETSFEVNKNQIILIDAVNMAIENIIKNHPEKREKIIKAGMDSIKNHPEYFKKEVSQLNEKYLKDPKYKDRIDYLTNVRIENKRKKVYNVGGLKYIQTVPFTTTRNDDQGKGRVGRQGEPGSTIMYASLKDIENFGIEEESYEFNKLKELLGDSDSINDEQTNGFIKEVIESAQSRQEFSIDYRIAMNDSTDLAMSSIGMMLLRNRKQVLLTNNTDVMIDNMIFTTIESMIKDSVPSKKIKKVDKNKTRLSRIKLDVNSLSVLVKDIFGMDIDFNDALEECFNVGDLKLYIYDKAVDKRNKLNMGLAKEKIDKIDKKNIVTSLNTTYSTFIDEAQNIELQIFNDHIVGNYDHNRSLEFQEIYKKCRKNGWYNCMKNVFRPGLREKTNDDFIDPSVNEFIEQLKEEASYEDLESISETKIR